MMASTAESRNFSAGRPLQPAKAGQEGGRADEVERVEAAEAVEIVGDGALERARLPPESLREQGLLEHFQRDARHELADVGDRAVAPTRQPLDGRRRDALHRRGEIRDRAGRKQRRKRPPLQTPGLALRRHQPVAQTRAQDPELQIVLAVIGDVVEEHAPDGGRVVGGRAQAEDRSADQDRMFEMRLAPDLERIAPERQDGVERAARLGRTGAERGERKAGKRPQSTS